MYFTKTPSILKSVSKDLTWNVATEKKELFLTFDDGPIPEVTPLVLEILADYKAKATFFCVGENALRNPDIIQSAREQGHLMGNHTFSHKNGWKSSKNEYLRDYIKCRNIIGEGALFRPPYGRIHPNQIQALKNDTCIVMWDVLSGDFDPNIDSEKCAQNVIQKAKPGSIVVFHDSLKAKSKMLEALPRVLEHFKEFEFCTLTRLLS